MSGRVTLDDIAAASQTSPATVSLALRNKPGVSQVTRDRILSIAQSLGYQRLSRQVDADGKELRHLAMIFRTWRGGPERSSPALNRFYSWVMAGIQQAASQYQLNLMLVTIPVDVRNKPAAIPEQVLRQPLDGAVIVGSFRPETIDTIRDLTALSRPPSVLVDIEHDQMDCVVSENTLGTVDATTYLLRRGHTRIAYFGPHSAWEPNFQQRRDGFIQAMADHGLEPAGVIEQSTASIASALAARTALASASDATAFVCGNDDYAHVLLRAASEAGRDVPGELSIVGFDDIERSVESSPALTTMAVDKLSLGRLAVELLEYRARWPEAAPLRFAVRPRLVERATVRALT